LKAGRKYQPGGGEKEYHLPGKDASLRFDRGKGLTKKFSSTEERKKRGRKITTYFLRKKKSYTVKKEGAAVLAEGKEKRKEAGRSCFFSLPLQGRGKKEGRRKLPARKKRKQRLADEGMRGKEKAITRKGGEERTTLHVFGGKGKGINRSVAVL